MYVCLMTFSPDISRCQQGQDEFPASLHLLVMTLNVATRQISSLATKYPIIITNNLILPRRSCCLYSCFSREDLFVYMVIKAMNASMTFNLQTNSHNQHLLHSVQQLSAHRKHKPVTLGHVIQTGNNAYTLLATST